MALIASCCCAGDSGTGTLAAPDGAARAFCSTVCARSTGCSSRLTSFVGAGWFVLPRIEESWLVASCGASAGGWILVGPAGGHDRLDLAWAAAVSLQGEGRADADHADGDGRRHDEDRAPFSGRRHGPFVLRPLRLVVIGGRRVVLRLFVPVRCVALMLPAMIGIMCIGRDACFGPLRRKSAAQASLDGGKITRKTRRQRQSLAAVWLMTRLPLIGRRSGHGFVGEDIAVGVVAFPDQACQFGQRIVVVRASLLVKATLEIVQIDGRTLFSHGLAHTLTSCGDPRIASLRVIHPGSVRKQAGHRPGLISPRRVARKASNHSRISASRWGLTPPGCPDPS